MLTPANAREPQHCLRLAHQHHIRIDADDKVAREGGSQGAYKSNGNVAEAERGAVDDAGAEGKEGRGGVSSSEGLIGGVGSGRQPNSIAASSTSRATDIAGASSGREEMANNVEGVVGVEVPLLQGGGVGGGVSSGGKSVVSDNGEGDGKANNGDDQVK